MRVVLVSTYELGHQPLHVASPARALLQAGHDVRCTDLAVDAFDADVLSWADGVAFSVPMHTAMRLARPACRAIRLRRPEVALCLYGLYAGLDGAEGSAPVADLAIAGEYEPGLVAWADALVPGGATAGAGQGPGARTVVELGRGRFGLPARHLLPDLDRYAQLARGEERHLAGYVEASHGCVHRCRHCPVPVVYDGRTRVVGEEAVVADVAQLSAMGARHVTFGDPDFLNGPRHAARVIDAVHGAFPEMTFDVTVKVEHILRHPDVWPRLGEAGCLFAVSAFESASDHILEQLDKGHSAAQEVEAVAILRAAGIEPRPSLLPFTPWTGPEDVFALLDLVARCDLVGNVDPVQYAIRLLVPPGSLLVTSGRLDGRLGPYDDEHLGWSWQAGDPRLDVLQARLSDIAELAAAGEWPAQESYDAARLAAVAILGERAASGAAAPEADPRLRSPIPADERPRLTEAWFCCAEPSGAQMAAVGAQDWACRAGGSGRKVSKMATGRATTQGTTAKAKDRHGPWHGAPAGAHEWVSFPDLEEERTWQFDVTFLESRWTCIFGNGCQGVLTGPAPEMVQGCCSYGAHFTSAKDARRVQAAAATLTPEQWQFHAKARPKRGARPNVVLKSKSGELTTRLVKDACIFLNRPDFPGGPGCALHRAAIERGVPHLELKPDVCWQLPLRRDDEVADDGHVTSVIRQWDRRDWGEGGFEFHWWCTESPEAFVGTRPVFKELEPELVAMVGKKIYKRLVQYLRAREEALGEPAVAPAPSSGVVGAPVVVAATRNGAKGNDAAPGPVPVRLPHPAIRRTGSS